jgi:hypothetical protein
MMTWLAARLAEWDAWVVEVRENRQRESTTAWTALGEQALS